jgi:hypothetical protein
VSGIHNHTLCSETVPFAHFNIKDIQEHKQPLLYEMDSPPFGKDSELRNKSLQIPLLVDGFRLTLFVLAQALEQAVNHKLEEEVP